MDINQDAVHVINNNFYAKVQYDLMLTQYPSRYFFTLHTTDGIPAVDRLFNIGQIHYILIACLKRFGYSIHNMRISILSLS